MSKASVQDWNRQHVRMEVFKVMGRSGIFKEHEKCGQALGTSVEIMREEVKMKIAQGDQ